MDEYALRKNQILTVEIEDITSEGEGIGKISGYPFFVKDAVIGDTVQIRVTRTKKKLCLWKIREGRRAFSFSCGTDMRFS